MIILGGSAATAALAAIAFPARLAAALGFSASCGSCSGCSRRGRSRLSRMMADWMPDDRAGAAQGLVWTSSRLGGALCAAVWSCNCFTLLELAAAGGRRCWSRVDGRGLVRRVLAVVPQPAGDGGRQRRRAQADRGGEGRRARRARACGVEGWPGRGASGALPDLRVPGIQRYLFLTLLPDYLRTNRGLDPATARGSRHSRSPAGSSPASAAGPVRRDHPPDGRQDLGPPARRRRRDGAGLGVDPGDALGPQRLRTGAAAVVDVLRQRPGDGPGVVPRRRPRRPARRHARRP